MSRSMSYVLVISKLVQVSTVVALAATLAFTPVSCWMAVEALSVAVSTQPQSVPAVAVMVLVSIV